MSSNQLLLSLDSVDISQPTQPSECLLRNLTFQINRHQHCLITCNASIRQALTKTLLGTWPPTKGTVDTPEGITHINGRPYIKTGHSLWDLMVFPHEKSQSQRLHGVGEPQLSLILKRLRLESLLEHSSQEWGRAVDWNKLLTKSELSGVSLCRLIYHSPALALLDDSVLPHLSDYQLSELFEVAQLHQITLMVITAQPVSTGFFSTHLEISSPDHTFQLHQLNQPIDTPLSPKWIWKSSQLDHQSRLHRRASTLSQCSTTERRWLSPTASSPCLTARSSVSDFRQQQASIGSAMGGELVAARARMLTIDSALSNANTTSISDALLESPISLPSNKYKRPPSPDSSQSTTPTDYRPFSRTSQRSSPVLKPQESAGIPSRIPRLPTAAVGSKKKRDEIPISLMSSLSL